MPAPTASGDGGWRRFRSTLRKAGDDLGDLKEVNASAAGIAADGALRQVPTVSGRLKATIRSSGTKTAGIVRVGNNSRVRYAGPVHWGWGRRHIRADAFASRGAQLTESAWVPLYENYLDNALDKIKGK